MDDVLDRNRITKRKASGLFDLGRSTFYYSHRKDPQRALRQRLRELSMDRHRSGYRRLHVLLSREGWRVNHQRVHRIDGEGA